MKRKRSQKGFTIVELVIVIAVIAILTSTLVPTFGDVIQRAQESAAKQAAKNDYTSYIVEHPEQAGAIFVYENDGQYVAIKDGAPIGTYENQSAALLALGLDVRASLNETGDGKLFIRDEQMQAPTQSQEKVPLNLVLTKEDYFTISRPETEQLSCAPDMVYYGQGRMAVAYLADDTQPKEAGNATILCRLGLFNLNDPENGQFFDIAKAGQTIGDITIGQKAPYEANLLKLSDEELLVLFNIWDNTGKYVYCYARFDTVSQQVTSYGTLKIDDKEWTPANVAAAYNTIADHKISAAGPTSSMVFTSKISKHGEYYYGYCGGICAGFSGIVVRSRDEINWEAVLAPESKTEMQGVIECGFEILDDVIYLCMRDISSGVYQCSYEWPTLRQLNKTEIMGGITTSRPVTFTQDGSLYLIVNLEVTDQATMGRRNTALFYKVDPQTCQQKLVRRVVCKGGCAYHSVVNVDGTNYWCFHTDARWIAPVDQGRSNLAFLKMPPMVDGTMADGKLDVTVYVKYYAKGCITLQTTPHTWQSSGANYHYQIPMSDFENFDQVTVTANADRETYIAFFTQRVTQTGAVPYAEGWEDVLVLEPGQTVTLQIPDDAAYFYILNNNGAGKSLLPQEVLFSTK